MYPKNPNQIPNFQLLSSNAHLKANFCYQEMPLNFFPGS